MHPQKQSNNKHPYIHSQKQNNGNHPYSKNEIITIPQYSLSKRKEEEIITSSLVAIHKNKILTVESNIQTQNLHSKQTT